MKCSDEFFPRYERTRALPNEPVPFRAFRILVGGTVPFRSVPSRILVVSSVGLSPEFWSWKFWSPGLKFSVEKWSPRTHFFGKNSPPNQVALRSDVIHGNIKWRPRKVSNRGSVQESYAGLKPDHEKAFRSFGNGRDVLRACQPWMDSLNASKIPPESLCRWKRCFFPGSSFLGDRNLGSLQRNVSGRRYRVPM